MKSHRFCNNFHPETAIWEWCTQLSEKLFHICRFRNIFSLFWVHTVDSTDRWKGSREECCSLESAREQNENRGEESRGDLKGT